MDRMATQAPKPPTPPRAPDLRPGTPAGGDAGVCGVFSKDVAATKVDQVTEAARKHGHPLQCISEPLEL